MRWVTYDTKAIDRWQSREDVGNSKNIRFTEAVACAEAFDFRLPRIHGSHHIYVHANVPELLNRPMVLEVPPRFLGAIDDYWFRWVTDIGLPGPNRGEGGRYLILSPGYDRPLPDGVKRGNWIQTMPGKGWFTILRLYSPLEPFFDKSWRPSEVELIS